MNSLSFIISYLFYRTSIYDWVIHFNSDSISFSSGSLHVFYFPHFNRFFLYSSISPNNFIIHSSLPTLFNLFESSLF